MYELDDSDNRRFKLYNKFSVTTWEWKRVTKTFAADTGGTLNDDNAVSFRLNIWLQQDQIILRSHTDNVWHSNAQTGGGRRQCNFYF